MGNWINILCFIIEAGRVTKKVLKMVVPISDYLLGCPPLTVLAS